MAHSYKLAHKRHDIIVENQWHLAGPQIRVRNWKLVFLFLNQNICCGYSKEPSRWDGSFEHAKQMFKLMDKKIIAGKFFCLTGPMTWNLCQRIKYLFYVSVWVRRLSDRVVYTVSYHYGRQTVYTEQSPGNSNTVSFHIINSIQLFRTFLCNSQNYHTWGAVDDPMALLHATVHRVIHSTEGVIVLTVAQEGMK